VRYRRASGGDVNGNVPSRALDAPITVSITTSHLPAFPIDRRRTEQDIRALGGDTLERLWAAVAAPLASRPGEYPGYATLLELKWTSRAP